MTTIPDTMKIISKEIQCVFEELIKLLLRKTLPPSLNPLGPASTSNIVYNNYRGKYERGLITSCSHDNVGKYIYSMTHDSLGWIDNNLVNFRAVAKYIRYNVQPKLPVVYNDSLGTIRTYSYNSFITCLTSRSMQSVIANRRGSAVYISDLPYTDSFRQLEAVGRDIIDQTDPCISGVASAKMSTAMLRIKLYNLECSLTNLAHSHPNIFDSYIEMVRIINSMPRNKMVWVINLVALLTYQSWENLTPTQQHQYLNALGSRFIDAFNDNELITILLQSEYSDLILTCSYLYPLLKMLFIVFGYSKLVPNIIPIVAPGTSACPIPTDFYKHVDRYAGATLRRQGCLSDTATISSPYCHPTPTTSAVPPIVVGEQPQLFDYEPVDQCIYDFIKLFGDLYPTLVGLMGGTENFPAEGTEINCSSIPPNYDLLLSIPEYLWRFNDYSYCIYLDIVHSRQCINTIGSKINARARLLKQL